MPKVTGTRNARCLALALAMAALAGCANKAPVITLSTDSLRLPAGVEQRLTVVADDPEGLAVTVTVSADRGFAIVQGGEVVYVAPGTAGADAVTVQAHDGTTATTSTVVVIVDDPLAWGDLTQVADTPGNSKSPALAVTDDGVVHVVWHDFTDDPTTLRHAALRDGVWESATLALGPDKALRGKLLADGPRLHLVYDRFRDGGYDVMHAVLQEGAWSPPALVGEGRKASPALLEGALHVVYYGVDDAPTHAAWTDGAWTDPSVLPITAPYINPIRLHLLAVPGGLELGILLSPGDTSYDMNVVAWSVATGWGDPTILFVSDFLGAEEPSGAVDPHGVARWVWAEQDPVDLWTFDIVTLPSPTGQPLRATEITGFNAMPVVAAPSAQGAQIAFVSDGYDLYVTRAPYVDEPTLIRSLSRDPILVNDSGGYLHLAWVGDVNGVEQILYATTRP